MTLPASWTQVPVTGTFLGLDGTPAQGRIVFLSAQVVVVDGVVVVPRKIVAELDANGYCSALLPSTNDPDLSVVGWGYTVVERFSGGRSDYTIVVPYTSAGIDLATVDTGIPDPVTINQYLRDSDIGTNVASQGAVVAAQAAAVAAQAGADAAQADATQGLTNAAAAQASADTGIAAAATAQTAADAAQADVDGHAARTDNPHATTKAQVQLALVDNTADADKPVSGPQQAALDTKLDDSQLDPDVTLAANSDTLIASQKATRAYVLAQIAALVASSPAALDTLNELAAALGDDPNFATTMTNALAGKQPTTAALTAFLALARGADQLPYATGANSFAQTALTSYARSLLASADLVALGNLLGLPALLAADPSTVPLDLATTGGNSRNLFVPTQRLGALGKLYTYGTNTTVNGTVVNSAPTRLFYDGRIDPSFVTAVVPTNQPSYMLCEQTDGKVLMNSSQLTSLNGVTFNTLTGRTLVPGTDGVLFRLNADGSTDVGFSVLALQHSLNAVLQLPDLTLLLGGWLTQVNGAARNGLAHLNANGTLAAVQPPQTAVDETVCGFCTQPDGKLLVYGIYSTLGASAYQHLGRLNADLSLDATFAGLAFTDSVAQGYSIIEAMIPLRDGRWMISGVFDAVNGHATSNVARLNADLTVDTTFTVALIDDAVSASPDVNSLVEQDDGRIVIGGYFTTVNGSTFRGMARLTRDGGVDTSFGWAPTPPNAGGDSTIVQEGPDGVLYAYAPSYTAVSGVAISGQIVRLDADGRLIVGSNRTFTTLDRADIAARILTSAKGAASGVVPLNAAARLDPLYRAKKRVTVVPAAGVLTLDLAALDDAYVVLAANITSTVFTNGPPAGYVREGTLVFVQDATGSRTWAPPAGSKWPNRLAAVLTATANAIDHIGYRVYNNAGTLEYTFYPARDIG